MHRSIGNSPQKLRKYKIVLAVKDERIYFGSQISSGSENLNVDELERLLVAAVKSGMGKGKSIHYATKVLQNLRNEQQQQQQREEEVQKFNNQQAFLSKEEKHQQLENEQEDHDDGNGYVEVEDFAEEDMEKSLASKLSVATSVGSRTATIPSPATSSSSITFDASIVQPEELGNVYEERKRLWDQQHSGRTARGNQEEGKEHRLAKEYMVLQKMAGLNDSLLEEDDEEIEQYQQSVRTICLSVATTVSHNSNSSTITTVDMSSLFLDESVSQQKPLWCMYERKSTCRRYSLDTVRAKERDSSGKPFPVEKIKEQLPLSWEYLTFQEKCERSQPEASVEKLTSLFRQYAKKDSGTKSKKGGVHLNVMQFSIAFRLVTGQKGNLFEEMKMFNKFDSSGKGFITEKDFVSGWKNEIIERSNNDVMKKVVRS